MRKEDFLKLIEDDNVTNRDGRFAIDLNYLLEKFGNYIVESISTLQRGKSSTKLGYEKAQVV